MIKVFYDGKCKLCSREVKYYKKIAPAGIFNWYDINQYAEELNKDGISLVTGLRWLHAKDENGKFHIGADAFILIWSKLERWHFLAKFTKLPIIHSIANLMYRSFAKWRFNRLQHCQIAMNKENRV